MNLSAIASFWASPVFGTNHVPFGPPAQGATDWVKDGVDQPRTESSFVSPPACCASRGKKSDGRNWIAALPVTSSVSPFWTDAVWTSELKQPLFCRFLYAVRALTSSP